MYHLRCEGAVAAINYTGRTHTIHTPLTVIMRVRQFEELLKRDRSGRQRDLTHPYGLPLL